MKLFSLVRKISGTLLLTASLGASTTAFAQETLIAAGNVGSSGSLDLSTSPIGASVSVVDSGPGDHDVVLDLVGGFAGTTVDDYFIEVGIERGNFVNDRGVTAAVSGLTDDQLVVTVRTADYEDIISTSGNVVEEIDEDFYFVIRRIPTGTTSIVGDSRHLIALGRVSSGGTLLSGFGIDGTIVSSQRNGVGEYSIALAKSGGFFLNDASQDYLILGAPVAILSQDNIIAADTVSTSGDDNVTFVLRTSDVQQNPDGNDPVAADQAFGFVIYRIDSDSEAGNPHTRLMSTLAKVEPDGTLSRGASSVGGVVTSIRESDGRYDVDVTAPGAFAGRNENEFVALATVDDSGFAGRQANVAIEIVSNDLLRVNVAVNDLENTGFSEGVAEDDGFFLTLFDTNAAFQPDLLIGRKRSLSTMKGNKLYNTSGGGQSTKVKLPGTKQQKFFFAARNDGRSLDSFRVKGKGIKKEIKARYFSLTGGRKNVTAKIRSNKEVASDLAPGETVLFQAKVGYTSAQTTPRRKLRLTGTSILGGGDDTVRAIVVPDN